MQYYISIYLRIQNKVSHNMSYITPVHRPIVPLPHELWLWKSKKAYAISILISQSSAICIHKKEIFLIANIYL